MTLDVSCVGQFPSSRLCAKSPRRFGRRLCFLDQLKAGKLFSEILWVFNKTETLPNIRFRETDFEGELQMELVWVCVQ
jgi:hypothetical protein